MSLKTFRSLVAGRKARGPKVGSPVKVRLAKAQKIVHQSQDMCVRMINSIWDWLRSEMTIKVRQRLGITPYKVAVPRNVEKNSSSHN